MNVKILTEELAERLKLEERAQQDAVAGLPETMATSLTAAETGAVAAADRLRGNACPPLAAGLGASYTYVLSH